MERLMLLASDVDFTLLGDDTSLGEFAKWYESTRSFVRLAYNSGRFHASVLQSTQKTRLPLPDAFIGGVGTEIRFPPDGRRLAGWPETSGTWNVSAIRGVLDSYPHLEPQPDEFQSEYKVSFFGDDLDESYLDCLREHFAEVGLDVNLIYSSGLHLDVLPPGANKGTAVVRLMKHWRLDPANVIVAGDSGNDLEMFRQGFRGIVVGNAQSELKRFTGQNAFHAEAHHAAGVLEGLHHWIKKGRGSLFPP
jgi:mannosylfructose-6-phosphate phosphatase